MQNIIGIQTKADAMAVYQMALLDKGLANRMAWLRTDPTIAAQGSYVVADCAVRWAQEAYADAKAAGACDGYEPQDLLALAAIALSGIIIDTGVI